MVTFEKKFKEKCGKINRKENMICTDIDIQDENGNWVFGYMHQVLFSYKDWKRMEEDSFERWENYVYVGF